MKTIKQHLESIEDEQLREAALRAMKISGASEFKAIRTHHAILQLYWGETIEGSSFWAKIHDSYKSGNTPTYSQFKHLIK